MATVGEAVIEVTLDDNSVSRSIGSIEGMMTRRFDAMSVAVGNLIADGVQSGLRSIGDSARAVVEFEDSFREVTTLINELPHDDPFFQQLEDDLLDFNVAMGRTSKESIPALYQSLSAGVPRDNVISFMEQAHKASAAGVTTLETAVDGLSSAVNAYGEETLSYARASDIMFGVVQGGKTNFEQLSNAISTVTGAAVAANVEFETVGAGLATITSTGTNVKVAATQMRSLIGELSQAGSQASETFKNLDAGALKPAGQTFVEFIEQGGDLNEALALMAGAAEKSGASIRDMFGNQLASNAAFVLGVSNAEKFSNELDRAANSAGATDAAFEKMGTTTQASIDQISAMREAILLDLGNAVLPAVSESLGLIAANAHTIRNSLQPAIQGLADSIGAATTSTTNFIAGFSGLEDVTGNAASLGAKVRSVVDDAQQLAQISFAPIADSLESVSFQALTDSQDAISQFVTEMQQLSEVNVLSGDFGAGALNAMSTLFDSLIKIASSSITELIQTGQQVGEGFVTGLREAMPSLLTFAGNITSSLTTAIVDSTGQLLASGASIVANIGKGIIENVPNLLSAATNVVNAFAQGVTNNLPQVGAAFGTGIGEMAGSIVKNAPALLEQGAILVSEIVRGIAQATPALLEAGGKFVTNIVTGFSEQLPSFESETSRVVPTIVSSLSGSARALVSEGGKFVKNLVVGFAEGFPDVLSAGTDLTTTLIDGITNSVPDLIRQAGSMIDSFVEALTSGNNSNTLANYGSTLVSDITTAISESASAIGSSGLKLITELTKAVGDASSQFVTKGSELTTEFVSNLGTNAPSLVAEGTRLVSNIVQGFVQALPSLVTQAGSIVNKIVESITTALPTLLQSGGQIVDNIVTGFREQMPTLTTEASAMFDAINTSITETTEAFRSEGGKIVSNLVTGIAESLPDMISTGGKIVAGLVEGVANTVPKLLTAASNMVEAFVDGIISDNNSQSVDGVGAKLIGDIVISLAEAFVDITGAGVKLVSALVQGINSAVGQVVSSAAQLALEFVGELLGLPDELTTLMQNSLQTMTDAAISYNSSFIEIGESIVTWLISGVGSLVDALSGKGTEALDGFISATGEMLSEVGAAGAEIVSTFVESTSDLGEQFANAGRQAVREMTNAIVEQLVIGGDRANNFFDDLFTFGGARKKRQEARARAMASGVASEYVASLESGLQTNAAQNVFETVLAGQETTEQEARLFGQLVTEAYVEGLTSSQQQQVAEIIENSERLGAAVDEGVRNRLGINSPSRVAQETFRFYTQPISQTLRDAIPEVSIAAGELGDAVDSGIRQVLEINSDSQRAIRTAEYFQAGLITGINNKQEEVKEAAQSTATAIDTTLRDAAEKFRDGIDTLLGQNLLGNVSTDEAVAQLEQVRATLVAEAQALNDAGNEDSDRFRQLVAQIRDVDAELQALNNSIEQNNVSTSEWLDKLSSQAELGLRPLRDISTELINARDNIRAQIDSVQEGGITSNEELAQLNDLNEKLNEVETTLGAVTAQRSEQRKAARDATAYADAISGTAVIESELNKSRRESAARLAEVRQATKNAAEASSFAARNTEDWQQSAFSLTDSLDRLNSMSDAQNDKQSESAQNAERAADAYGHFQSAIASSLASTQELVDIRKAEADSTREAREATGSFTDALTALNNQADTVNDQSRRHAQLRKEEANVLKTVESTLFSVHDAAQQGSKKSLEQFENFKALREQISGINSEPLTVFEKASQDLESMAQKTGISEQQLKLLREQLANVQDEVQGETFTEFNNQIKEITESGDSFSNLEASIREAGDAGELSAEQVEKLVNNIKDIEKVRADTKKLAGDLKGIGGELKNLGSSLESAGMGGGSALDFLGNSLGGISESMGSVTSGGFDIVGAFEAVAGSAKSSSDETLQAIGSMAQGAMDIGMAFATGDILGGIMGGIKALGGIFSLFGRSRRRAAEEAKKARKAFERELSLTRSLIDEHATGLSERVEKVVNWYGQLFNIGSGDAETEREARVKLNNFMHMIDDNLESLDELNSALDIDVFDQFHRIDVSGLSEVAPTLGAIGQRYQELIDKAKENADQGIVDPEVAANIEEYAGYIDVFVEALGKAQSAAISFIESGVTDTLANSLSFGEGGLAIFDEGSLAEAGEQGVEAFREHILQRINQMVMESVIAQAGLAETMAEIETLVAQVLAGEATWADVAAKIEEGEQKTVEVMNNASTGLAEAGYELFGEDYADMLDKGTEDAKDEHDKSTKDLEDQIDEDAEKLARAWMKRANEQAKAIEKANIETESATEKGSKDLSDAFGNFGDIVAKHVKNGADNVVNEVEQIPPRFRTAAETAQGFIDSAANNMGNMLTSSIKSGIESGDWGSTSESIRAGFQDYVVNMIITQAVNTAMASAAAAEPLKRIASAIAYAVASGDWSGVASVIEAEGQKILDLIGQIGDNVEAGLDALGIDLPQGSIDTETTMFDYEPPAPPALPEPPKPPKPDKQSKPTRDSLKETAKQVDNAADEAAQKMENSISEMFDTVSGALREAVSSGDFEAAHDEMMASFDEKLGNQIIDAAMKSSQSYKIAGQIMAKLPDMLATAMETGDYSSVAESIQTARDKISGQFKRMEDGLREAFEATGLDIPVNISGEVDTSEAEEELQEQLEELADSAKELISEAVDNALTSGDLETSGDNMLLAYRKQVIDKVKQMAMETAVASLTVAEKMHELEPLIAEGIESGDFSALGDAVGNITNDLSTALQSVNSSVESAIGDMEGISLSDYREKVETEAQEQLQEHIERVTEIISDSRETFDEILEDSEGIGVSEYFQNLGTSFTSTISSMQEAANQGLNTEILEESLASTLLQIENFAKEYNAAKDFLASGVSDAYIKALENDEVGLEEAQAILQEQFQTHIIRQIVDMASQALFANGIVASQMAQLAPMISNALATGDWSGVEKQINSIGEQLQGKLANMAEELNSAMESMFSKSPVKTTPPPPINTKPVTRTINKAKNDVDKALQEAKKVVEGGISKAFTSAFFSEDKTLREAADDMQEKFNKHIVNKTVDMAVQAATANAKVSQAVKDLQPMIEQAIETGDFSRVANEVSNIQNKMRGTLNNVVSEIGAGLQMTIDGKPSQIEAVTSTRDISEQRRIAEAQIASNDRLAAAINTYGMEQARSISSLGETAKTLTDVVNQPDFGVKE